MEKYPTKNHLRFALGLVSLFIPCALTALEARLSLENDRYVVGQTFNLDIVVNDPHPLQVKLIQPSYPSSLVVSEGPFIRKTSLEGSPENLLWGTRISLSFKVIRSGLVSLGPFVVTSGSSSITLPSTTLYLLEKDESHKRFPLEVRWMVAQGPFYQGQDIPVLLQVRHLDTLVYPQDLEVSAPDASLWEKVTGLGEIEISSSGEDRIMNIPWGAWMLIPTRGGSLSLPSVTLKIENLQRKVASQELKILPLPKEVQASRAIGSFSYSIEVQKNQSEGLIAVVQEVKGRGNFPYLIVPEVKIKGLEAFSRREAINYQPTTIGYQGSLIVTTRFFADKVGHYQISLPGFQSFQPENAKVWTWKDNWTMVDITNLGDEKNKGQEKKAPLLSWEQVIAARSFDFLQKPLDALFLLPGFLFWSLTFVFAKRAKKSSLALFFFILLGGMSATLVPESFNEAVKTYENDDFATSVVLWERLLERSPREPGLWYNKGLACAALEKTPQAIHALRTALRLGFQGPQAGMILKQLQEESQLKNQHGIWLGPSQGVIYLIAVIAINLFFIFWGLQRLTTQVGYLICCGISFFLALGLFFLSASLGSENHQVDAIIGLTDGPLKRVPSDLAEEWMTLKKGTSIHSLGFMEGFFLVQTGYGLQGWIKENYLMPVEK